ncbi:MAG: glucose 1-dehydrogenase [Anaerolineae bacterium]
MADLTGKVAFVTGAGLGIGYAAARALAQAGAAVVVNDVAAARADAAAAGIVAAGGQAAAFAGDMASVANCRALVQFAVETYGRLDIACCNAGITSWGGFLDYSEAHFDQVVGVNLKGTYFSAQAAAQQMIAQGGGGRIILTSSVTGNKAVRNLSAYAMTKGGLQMLARNLVLELSPHGITINAVAPGAIVTERNLHDDPQYAEHWAAVVPLGRAGQPQDIATAVVFLASDDASYITGQTLIIDGGVTAVGLTPDQYTNAQQGRRGQ